MERGYFYTGPQRAIGSFVEFKREENEDPSFSLPTTIVVCGRCGGRGVHDPWEGPVEDEAWDDPDFAEAYHSGRYDVTCEECGGANVVHEVDWEQLTPEVKAELESWLNDVAESNQMSAMERMMGA